MSLITKSAPLTLLKYTELLYIEATGTQYIDTLYKPNSNTRIVCDFQFMQNDANEAYLFGVRDDRPYANRIAFVLIQSNYFRHGYGTHNAEIENITEPFARYTVDYNRNVCTIGDKSVTNTAETFSSNYNLCLCCVSTTGTIQAKSKVRIYSCKIYDNDILVRDLIPARLETGEVGLYDKANNYFFKNAGEGNFLGAIKEGYQLLSYIEGTGTQYIETNFTPNNNTRLIAEFQYTNTEGVQYLFCVRDGSDASYANRYGFLLKENVFRSDYGNSNAVYPSSLDVSLKYIVDKNKNICLLNGNLVSNSELTFNSNNTLPLLAGKTGGKIEYNSKVKLYYCKIYDNGNLIRDYYPVKNSENKIGLLDIVNNQFYQNAGTGEFVGGE